MSNLTFFKTAVVVSTYNRPDALKIVLESLLAQTMMPHEIIIADDGSGEQTLELINDYINQHPNLITHIWHEDTGFRLSAIRNKAMASAQSDYIIQIDGDIMLHPRFIADHNRIAKTGYFVAGSRAMLSQKLTSKILSSGQSTRLCFLKVGIMNRFNALRIPIIMKLMASSFMSNKSYKKIKGCHMAFWKKDLLAVNGYNEDFIGWGSEDVEIEIRLKNSGLKRRNLKFGALQYHLYHPENSKAREHINEELVIRTSEQRLIRCTNGMDKYVG